MNSGSISRKCLYRGQPGPFALFAVSLPTRIRIPLPLLPPPASSTFSVSLRDFYVVGIPISLYASPVLHLLCFPLVPPPSRDHHRRLSLVLYSFSVCPPFERLSGALDSPFKSVPRDTFARVSPDLTIARSRFEQHMSFIEGDSARALICPRKGIFFEIKRWQSRPQIRSDESKRRASEPGDSFRRRRCAR